MGDAAFVLAHELLHLALDTHNRVGDSPLLLGNFAHDYIINDILGEEMDRKPPLNGLFMRGAREKSLEDLMVELSGDGNEEETRGSGKRCWRQGTGPGESPLGKPSAPRSPLSRALRDAGLLTADESEPIDEADLPPGDLIPPEHEDMYEPDISPEARERRRERVRREAVKAGALDKLKKTMEAGPGAVIEPQRGETTMNALHAAYHTPWQLALQRWMDAVAPGERTYARPSRRSGDRTDVVLPGRRREGWVLHIVLDTSGSMVDYLPKALGAIASFCESSSVGQVHLLQCDTEVTHDDWVEPEQLAEYRIAGFGYSDMRPAMRRLLDDPEVASAIVLTDGYIDILEDEPPYQTLFVLLGDISTSFAPPYGIVVQMD